MHSETWQSTPPWRIWLKTRVDRTDRTLQIYTQKYVKIRQDGRAHYFESIKLCRLIAKINTRFQPDVPRWCSSVTLAFLAHGSGNAAPPHVTGVSPMTSFPCPIICTRVLEWLSPPPPGPSSQWQCSDGMERDLASRRLWKRTMTKKRRLRPHSRFVAC